MKTTNLLSFAGMLGVGLLGIATSAHADVVVTYAEAPGATTSTVSNTQVFNFDNLPTGLNTDVSWAGVGTFNQLYIKPADAYGGAADAANPNGSNYAVTGSNTGLATTTLNLNTPSSYFGMWWSAGDPYNVMSFYDNGVLVEQFSTASLMNILPSTYDGNPLNGENGTQPYAFINFYGSATTQWNEIVFSNPTNTGFEMDNLTTRVAAVPTNEQTGVVVPPAAPAPPLTALIAFGAVALLKWRKSSGNAAEEEAVAA